MNDKGTINLEFLIVIMILTIICSMLVSLSSQEFDSIIQTQNRKEARLIATDISQTINEVYIHGDGYSKTYTTPSKINNESYVVILNDSGIYINSHYQLLLYENNFTNSIKKYNENRILSPDTTYNFINKNNTIIITENK